MSQLHEGRAGLLAEFGIPFEAVRAAVQFSRIVDWLVSEAEEAAPPIDSTRMPGCPRQREGFVIERWRCQWWVAKPTRIQDNIDGIVFVPAY